MNPTQLRFDLRLIADMVEPRTRVLDVGCGEGELLKYLRETKKVDGRGIELSMSGVSGAVRQGLSVIQGDADTDLKDYPAGAFDYVILSQTLQATRNPREVLEQMLRIGRHAIVSLPNFGHWRVRLSLLVHGRMPVTSSLGFAWYDTPNIHLCTMDDFIDLTDAIGAKIEKGIAIDSSGRTRPFSPPDWKANLFGENGLFLLGNK